MKILAVTYGTEGDTRPIAALGRALVEAGHQVSVMADAKTLGSARDLGISAMTLTGNIKATLEGPGENPTTSSRPNTATALSALANQNTESWMSSVTAASMGCDAILVSGLAAFVGLSVAEYRKIKAIGVGLIPISPTSAFPSPFLPQRLVPSLFNHLSHRMVNALVWRSLREATNHARASVCGLPPRKQVWTGHPMLYGVSPSLLPATPDWPANTAACGQWVVPNQTWQPPEALRKFLAEGEPPVYAGFGSMAKIEQGGLMDGLIRATSGRRVVFSAGWSGFDQTKLPSNFFPVDNVPHDWLFPRVSMAIHHGGSGTTHSATRAGIPSVVVPFAGDQFFWADRLRQLGVSSGPVTGRGSRQAGFERAIEYASKGEARHRAAALGRLMAEETGLQNGVNRIEGLLQSP